MKSKHSGHKATSGRSTDFIVRINIRENADLQGRVQHVQSGHFQYFQSYLELLFLIQERLDQLKHPQASMEIRTWES